jgi:predicted membrane channel-forming protein YqfA (hemolysin III family)
MRLSAPKQVVFIISVILLVIGLVAFLGKLALFPGDAFWITFAGGVLLAAGAFFKGI